MDDYIRRSSLLKLIATMPSSPITDREERLIRALVSTVKEFPAADVRPVVRAVWRRYSPFTDTYECSNCGEQVIDQQFRTNFCPHCGAWMEES